MDDRRLQAQGGEAANYDAVARQRRAYFIYGLSLISLSSLFVFVFIVLFINHRYYDLSYIGTLIIFYFWLISRLKAGKVEMATLAITLVGGGGYFIVGSVDPAGNTGLLLFNTFPILAFFLHGRRRGILLTLIFTAVMLIFYYLDQSEIFPLPYSVAVYRNFIITFIITVVMVYFYQDLIDASERIIANRDRQLAAERDQAKAVVTSIGEGVMVLNAEGKITDINPVALAWFGIQREAVLNRRPNEIFQVYQGNQNLLLEQYPSIRSLKSGRIVMVNQEDDYYFSSLPATPSPLREREQLLTKKGRFPVSIVAAPLHYEGQVTGVVVVFRDITADKEASAIIEREVQERTHEVLEGRARLLASINSLDLGYMMTNEQPAVLMVNNAAFTILSKAGLLNAQPTVNVEDPPIGGSAKGQQPAVVLSLDDIDQKLGKGANFIQQIRRCMTEGKIVRLTDLRFGKVFLEITIAPIHFEHKVVGTVIVIQDVTEVKVLDRAKDEFFTIASHELRTPLTIIRGNVANIETMHTEHLKDQGLASKLKVIQEACIRLINIVNDFLNLSRLEQGRVVFNREAFAVEPVLEAVKNEAMLLAKQKGLAIVIEPASTPLPAVWADKDRVKQVLLNLVSNSIKYTDTGTITIRQNLEQSVVKLVVEDTGHGIPAPNQALLFHKFQQAGDSILTRDVSGGTGLGLYIAKLVVEGMGGKIWLAHSEVDKGSTFAFTVPVATQEQKNRPKKELGYGENSPHR